MKDLRDLKDSMIHDEQEKHRRLWGAHQQPLSETIAEVPLPRKRKLRTLRTAFRFRFSVVGFKCSIFRVRCSGFRVQN